MKILIISPPYAASEPPRIPMGLLYISGALEEAGHEVRVLDLLVSKFDRDMVVHAVKDFGPAMVGVTSVTMNWPDASQILRWVKEADPQITTVAGGPHATFTWEDIGASETWVDYVVRGEGEKTVVELLDAIEKDGLAKDIAGLAWRENGAMKAGPPRDFEQDLDSLPKPARHLFPLSRYRAMWVDGGVSTGRGCPFQCIFCVGSRMVGRKARIRSPRAVVEEIEELVKMGFEGIAFSDDHFGMKRSHAFAMCDEIIDRDLDIDLSIFIRADAAEPELLDRMRKAGCTKILYGAESGVQKIVDIIKKKTDLNMLREKVKLAVDMDYQVQVTFIMGLPGETPETIKQTFEYARSLGTFFGMHVLAPLPGSELFEKADELGLRILHRNWSLYDANHVVSETVGISAAELEKVVVETDAMFDGLERMQAEAWSKRELTGVDLERMKRHRCKTFYWELLRGGFFDGKDCEIETAGCENPLDALTKNAASLVGVEEWEAEMWIKRAMDNGDLLLVDKGSVKRFEFSDKTYPEMRQVAAVGDSKV